jgi:hypothetical protein
LGHPAQVRRNPITPLVVAVGARLQPDMAEAGTGPRGGFGRQSSRDPIAVHDVGGLNVHGTPEACGIHEQLPRPAFTRLGALSAARPTDPCRLHTLTVNDTRTRLGLAPQRQAEVCTSWVVTPLPGPSLAPRAQGVRGRFPVRAVVRHTPPLTARPQHIDDRLEPVPPGVLPWSTRLVRRGPPRCDDIPCMISQSRRISEACPAENVHSVPLYTPFSDSFLYDFPLTMVH